MSDIDYISNTILAGCRVKLNERDSVCSWYNGSSLLLDTPTQTIRHQSVLQEDNTYLTSSYINMRLGPHHHGMVVRCLATNEVLEWRGQEPQEDSLVLSVKFSPVMTALEAVVTVNVFDKVREEDTECLIGLPLSPPRAGDRALMNNSFD